MEESDQLSPQAMNVLRYITEVYSDYCRFIFTCNHVHRITPHLRSRFKQFNVKTPNKTKVLERVVDILISENLNVDETYADIISNYVNAYYPDIRKIINEIEEISLIGNNPNINGTSTIDFKYEYVNNFTNLDFDNCIKIIQEQVPDEEIENLYTLMYTNIPIRI